MKLCAACGARFNSVGWTCPTCYYQPQLIEGYLAFAPEAEVNDGFEAIFFPQLARVGSQKFLVPFPQPFNNLGITAVFTTNPQFF